MNRIAGRPASVSSLAFDRAAFEGFTAVEILAEANSHENTQLRDAFAQAARVSAALGG